MTARRWLLAGGAVLALLGGVAVAVGLGAAGDSKDDEIVAAYRASIDDADDYTDDELRTLALELTEATCSLDPDGDITWPFVDHVETGVAVADVSCPAVADALRRSYGIRKPLEGEVAELCALAQESLRLTTDPPADLSEPDRQLRLDELSAEMEELAPPELRAAIEQLEALGPDAKPTDLEVQEAGLRVAMALGELCEP